MLKLPIGHDLFQELIEYKLDFVDKTLFIKELLDDPTTKVALITRPRRFGKTLNLSMLQCFFASTVMGKPTKDLFDGLNITRVPGDYMQYQGKYPVIFITFKSVKDGGNFDHALGKIARLMSGLYGEHRYLLLNESLTPDDRALFQKILERKADQPTLENSLQYLTRLLYQHHGVKPWLLIDEYDSPIHGAYLNGYYNEMISFMRSMFGDALKTNPYLGRAVITGILRVSKESLFSGLNNIEVFSMLRRQYGEYFGFTEGEVSSLLQQSELSKKAEEIKAWYNGYQIKDITLYNPWSIANCIKQEGLLQPYWVNTSGNDLVSDLLLKRSNDHIKLQFESILQGESIETVVNENIVFSDLDKRESAVWSLLLMTGYLKPKEVAFEGEDVNCKLLAPNREVMGLYERFIIEYLTDVIGESAYKIFLKNLVEGHIQEFTRELEDYLLESASYFDTTGHHPESFYHGFVMGLIVSLRKTHIIKSNRESGFGRYDVMLIPNDKSKLGIIMEFKIAQSNEDLIESAQKGLKQIFDKQYALELKKQGVSNLLHIGLAFRGKEVAVEYS